MKYHLVIDGISGSGTAGLRETNAFCRELPAEVEAGEAFRIGRKEDDLSKEEIPAGKVRCLTAEDPAPETFLEALEKWTDPEDLYIFDGGPSGNELAVRLAARCGGSSLTGVISVYVEDGQIYAKKPVYAGYMTGKFLLKKGPFCISIRKGGEKDPCTKGNFSLTGITEIREEPGFIVSKEFIPEETDRGLADSRLVIAAGRGAGSSEEIKKMEKTAASLGGMLGATRMAAMNAWVPMNRLIGVSGKMIAPEICIVAGASGAPAFYAGIEKSRLIIAVNKDRNAPIFRGADVAVCDDCRPVMEELGRLASRKKEACPPEAEKSRDDFAEGRYSEKEDHRLP